MWVLNCCRKTNNVEAHILFFEVDKLLIKCMRVGKLAVLIVNQLLTSKVAAFLGLLLMRTNLIVVFHEVVALDAC